MTDDQVRIVFEQILPQDEMASLCQRCGVIERQRKLNLAVLGRAMVIAPGTPGGAYQADASLLLARGVSVAYVKAQLGHASIKMTVDTYSHYMPADRERFVDQLDDVTLGSGITPALPVTEDGLEIAR